MESLKRSIRYQFIESKKFILGLWGTTLIVNIFFYILNNMSSTNSRIGFSIGLEGNYSISVAGINLMILFISLLVYNFESNYESFPLAISLSVSRKDYFTSFLLDNIFISFVFAVIQGILLKVDPFFIKLVGKVPLYDFFYFNTKTDNILFIILILFIAFLSFTSLWSLIASLNYKFGYKMWIVLIGSNILFSIFNLDPLSKFMKSIGEIFEVRPGSFPIFLLMASTAAMYALNYFVVKRTNIKKSIN